MAHPQTPQQMEEDYEHAVEHVTERQYCAPQERLGVLPSVCEERYRHYHRAESRPATAEKYLNRYENA